MRFSVAGIAPSRVGRSVLIAVILAATAGITVASRAAAAPGPSATKSALRSLATYGNANGSLNTVSCASAQQCLAIGDYLSSTDSTPPLAEEWNGSKWASAAPPLSPSIAEITTFSDVACPRVNQCLAVGSYRTSSISGGPLAEEWDGATWKVLPEPVDSGGLLAISCASSTFCMATGGYGPGGGFKSFAEQWNGARWSIVSSFKSSSSTVLSDLSCASASACVVTGDEFNGGTGILYTEVWNGRTWSSVLPPSPKGANFDSLDAVSCASPASCLAVGTTSAGTPTGTLAETWNGKSWTVVAAPPVLGLVALSCSSATACLAVGNDFVGINGLPLAESWNGKTWRVVSPAPPKGTNNAFLSDVWCRPGGTPYCMLVGSYAANATDFVNLTLAELWNGTSFSREPTPNQASPVTHLSQGITWVSKDCPDSSAEVENALDPKLGYLYEDWIGCGSSTIGFARSTDGGRTYSKPIDFSAGKETFTWDPAITVAPDGTVYASFMAQNLKNSYPVVEVSFDHGATFRVISQLIPAQVDNWGDRDFIAAGTHGTVYMSWDYGPSSADIKTICPSGGSCSFSNGDLNMVVQKSTDYGRHWGPMVHVSPNFPAGGADAGPMVVEPDGQIDMVYQALAVTNKKTFALGPGHEYFTQSTDGGAKWTHPYELAAQVGSVSLDEWWIDADIGIDAGGNLYASWDTQGAEDVGWMVSSTNHGQTWSPPVQVTSDKDTSAHITQVEGGAAGEVDVGWLTNSSPNGWALYLRPYAIAKGWLGSPVRASLNTYGFVWPGDTFGMANLGTLGVPANEQCVAVTWGGGVLRPLGAQQGEMFATNVGLEDSVSPLCPRLPGYRLESGAGGVLSYHQTYEGSLAPSVGATTTAAAGISNAVATAAAPAGGYWVVGADGGVFAFGTGFYGSLPGDRVHVDNIVGAAATPDGKGYWLASASGAVYAFGDAQLHGSMAGRPLAAPVVGIVASPDGKGYWLVAADGGVFAFGDSHFHGSMVGRHLDSPAVGLADANGGSGYWIAAKDGGVFTFGGASYLGSCPVNGSGCHGVADVVGIASPDGGGYWLAGADGGVFTFGDAQYFGSAAGTHLSSPIVGITS